MDNLLDNCLSSSLHIVNGIFYWALNVLVDEHSCDTDIPCRCIDKFAELLIVSKAKLEAERDTLNSKEYLLASDFYNVCYDFCKKQRKRDEYYIVNLDSISECAKTVNYIYRKIYNI